MKRKRYLVVGVYAEDASDRYACEVEANSPKEAEDEAQRQCLRDNDWDRTNYPHNPLIVAGVICGRTDKETSALEVVA